MTVADYQPFVERMIQRYEGGYGWDRDDPGGPTKFGITCFDLAEFDHQPMDSMAHWAPIVEAMPLATADIIYADKYATPVHFNDLNPGKDCVVFDFGVNSGTGRSIRYSQSVVGVSVDGVLGPITLAAINAFDPAGFINGLCNRRLAFLQGLPTWPRFGGGWGSRVVDLRNYALNLAAPKLSAGPRGYSDKPALIPGAFAKAWAD